MEKQQILIIWLLVYQEEIQNMFLKNVNINFQKKLDCIFVGKQFKDQKNYIV